MHTQLKCHGTRSMFNLDYLPFMKSIIYNPIADNSTVGVDDVIDRMIDYDLVRTDWDSIVDLSQWSSSKLKPIETKAKSAFTRKVNKIDRQLPYSLSVITKAKNDTFNGGLDQDEEDSLPDEDKNDPMIKELSTPAPKPAKKKITRKVKT
uniref:Replication factor C subunit 1 (Trinotate prediction) n=1 Tax=Henneguya salminicola TaxID=69463 RepID=A0A6G3MHN6_HENSL